MYEEFIMETRSYTRIGKANQEQGKLLEEYFSEFMKSDLGYFKADRKISVHSKDNPKGIEVDIIAVKRGRGGAKIIMLSKVMLYLSTAFVSVPLILGSQKLSYLQIVLLTLLGLTMILLSALILNLVDKYATEYAWVECKSSKDKTTYEEVQKVIADLKSHKNSRDKEFDITYKYFVSINGFIPNALSYAQNNDIICYICEEKRFVQVE